MLAVFYALALSACGGIAVIDRDGEMVGSGNGGGLTATTSSEVGTTATTSETTTTTTTSSGAGGDGGSAPLDIELIVAPLGPPTDAAIENGTNDRFFEFSLKSVGHNLEIKQLRIMIVSKDGGLVRGSKGSKYFYSVTIEAKDFADHIMGPAELEAADGATKGIVTLTDAFVLGAGVEREFQAEANIAASEDAPGELFMKNYHGALLQIETGEVVNLDDGLPLSPLQVAPAGDVTGWPQPVSLP